MLSKHCGFHYGCLGYATVLSAFYFIFIDLIDICSGTVSSGGLHPTNRRSMAHHDRLFDLDEPNQTDVLFTDDSDDITFTPAEAAVLEAVALKMRANVCYTTTRFCIQF